MIEAGECGTKPMVQLQIGGVMAGETMRTDQGQERAITVRPFLEQA